MSESGLLAPARPHGARGARRLERAAAALLAIATFAVSMAILQRGAGAIAAPARDVLGPRSLGAMIGAGWLASYPVLSGSPVAAAALALFDRAALDGRQCYAAIAGTRLGTVTVALAVAALYGAGRSREGLGTGVLASVVTQAIGWVALGLGLALLPLGAFAVALPGSLERLLAAGAAPALVLLDDALPGWAACVLGVGGVIVALALLDRAVPLREAPIDARPLAGEGGRFLAFAAGFVATLLTPSMAVAIGLLVPLRAKGWLPEARVVPWVMGANIAAYSDTLIAALLLGDRAATNVVATAVVALAVVSLAVLLGAGAVFERAMVRASRAIAGSPVALAVFVVGLVAAPLALVALG